MSDLEYAEIDDQCYLENGEGHDQQVVTMRIIAEGSDANFYQGQCDRDGDAIEVRCATKFVESWDNETITINFAQGTSADRIARSLKKCIEMVEGSEGHRVVNLSPGEEFPHSVVRRSDGEVAFITSYDEFVQYLKSVPDPNSAD